MLDEDAAHRFGGGEEELRVARRAQRPVVLQPQEDLVDQRRRLERVVRPLVGQPLPRQPAELVVDGGEPRVERRLGGRAVIGRGLVTACSRIQPDVCASIEVR